MGSCVVQDCNNYSKNYDDDADSLISFHKFPKETLLRNKWIEACCVEENKLNADARICSIHFSSTDDFEKRLHVEKTGLKWRNTLNKSAVPHLLLPGDCWFQEKKDMLLEDLVKSNDMKRKVDSDRTLNFTENLKFNIKKTKSNLQIIDKPYQEDELNQTASETAAIRLSPYIDVEDTSRFQEGLTFENEQQVLDNSDDEEEVVVVPHVDDTGDRLYQLYMDIKNEPDDHDSPEQQENEGSPEYDDDDDQESKQFQRYVAVSQVKPLKRPEAVLPNPARLTQIPSNKEFVGEYNFAISVNADSSTSMKNMTLYSKILNKLFVTMGQVFPVELHWKPHRPDLVVRAMLLYSAPQHAPEPVVLCHIHSSKENNKGVNPALAKHVLRCRNTDAVHYYGGNTKEHGCVLLPLGVPQAGSNSVRALFEFACKNSCSSMNRRTVEVIFTLETMDGKVLGRRKLATRICSCPKRDKDKEERTKIENDQSPMFRNKMKRKSRSQPGNEERGEPKEIDSNVYNVTFKIVGRHNYQSVLTTAFNAMAGDMIRGSDEKVKMYKHYMSAIESQLISSKDRCKTPDSPEGARLVAPRSPVSPQQHMGGPLLPPARHSNGSASPHLNGSMGSLTPPLPTPGVTPLVVDPPQSFGTPGSSQRPLVKVKRFLSTLVTFGQDISPEIGDRVRSLVLSLVSTGLGIEEFQHSLQEVTNFPLRPFVLPFLRAHLPLLQREVQSLARVSKQTPLQYVYAHDHVVLDPAHSPAEAADIFLPNDTLTTPGSVLKRRASDTFHDGQTNGVSHSEMGGDFSPPKRPHPSLLLNPSPLLLPLHQHQSLFEYPNYPTYQSVGNHEMPSQERRELSTGNLHLNYDHGRSGGSSDRRNDDEWKNINTMLNCILSMVEKTKRALSILQTRGNPPDTSAAVENGDIRRLVNEILAATVRQTEERVAEVKRRAEDAVNQVKRQAVLELQRAVSHAETKAVELVAVERAKMEKIMTAHKQNVDESRSENHDNSNSPPAPTAPQQNACWNCGRKANETCSGCNVARYCGSFCQHRDWETRHHQSCGSTDAVSKTASRILPVQPNVSAANTNCGNTLSISTVNAKCSILPSGTTSAANSTISSNIAGERIPPLKK